MGVVSPEPIDETIVRSMRDALAHRGPDGSGLWYSTDRCVAIGHRRLAILDLSPAGAQPMSRDGTLHVVFNGEIYNFAELRRELEKLGHRFASSGDTEVLLAAYAEWGESCVDRLHGMFAFAVLDARRRRLFLARDRAGEKPLFYMTTGGRFLFGSELKAIFAYPDVDRRIDLAALDAYLSASYVTGDLCLLRGARKLPPAHAMTLDLDTLAIRVWRYWDIPAPDPRADERNDQELQEELEARLAAAVRAQMVSDVPIGILLSGGVDSSLIAALAARSSGQRVRTFTIRFAGSGSFDEGPHAALVARHLGTEHEELAAEPISADLLPILARQVDEPIGDSSLVPTYMVARLVRRHAAVALGGDGGDELFGGYLHYDRLRQEAERRRRIPLFIRSPLAAAAQQVLPAGLRGRDALMALARPQIERLLDRPWRQRLVPGLRALPPEASGRSERAHAIAYEEVRGVPGALMATDFRTYMPEDILVKVDRASMLTSLEIRAPLLDVGVVEFAFRNVPNRLRSTRTARKILLKRLAKKHLPSEFDLTRKQGFGVPMQLWDRGQWGDAIREVLHQSRDGFFDRGVLTKMLAGRWPIYAMGERLFGLAMLELWRREYRMLL